MRLLTILILVLLPAKLSAAPCCGGGGGSGTLIFGDEAQLFEYSLRFDRELGKTEDFGMAVLVEKPQVKRSLELTFANVLVDPWQIFASTGLVIRSLENVQMQDSTIGLAHQVYRNYIYSKWKPEVYVSLAATVPTGTSFYQNRSTFSDESLYKIRPQIHFKKNLSKWSLGAKMAFEKSFAREFSSGTRFSKGLTLSTDMTIGYRPEIFKKAQLFYSQTALFGFPNRIENNDLSERSLSSIAFPLALGISYAHSDAFTSTLLISDLTLVTSQNTSLKNSISLTISHYWF